MKFSIKKYYELNDSVTFHDVLSIFVKDVEQFENKIIELFDNCANNTDFIYPNSDIIGYKKIKDLTLISLLINNVLSNNPIFALHAETIYMCQKMLTLDVFIFFFKLIYLKLKELEEFNVSSFSRIIDSYNSFLNKKYYYSPKDLLKLNIEEISENLIDKKVEIEFK